MLFCFLAVVIFVLFFKIIFQKQKKKKVKKKSHGYRVGTLGSEMIFYISKGCASLLDSYEPHVATEHLKFV